MAQHGWILKIIGWIQSDMNRFDVVEIIVFSRQIQGGFDGINSRRGTNSSNQQKEEEASQHRGQLMLFLCPAAVPSNKSRMTKSDRKDLPGTPQEEVILPFEFQTSKYKYLESTISRTFVRKQQTTKSIPYHQLCTSTVVLILSLDCSL